MDSADSKNASNVNGNLNDQKKQVAEEEKKEDWKNKVTKP